MRDIKSTLCTIRRQRMQALHIFNASIAFLASTWHKKKNLDIVWGNLWASSVPLSARPVCISLPALPVNVVSRHRARRRRSRQKQQQTSRQRAKESLSLYWTFMWANLCVISASLLQSIPLMKLCLAPAVEH